MTGDFQKGITSGINLSFAGCGFLGIYHVGVCTCFREYAPHLVADQISGASAGALCACALICGCGLGDATTFTLNLATKARARALGPLHPSFDLVGYLRSALRSFLPHNCHEIASGRLHISLTRVSDRKNVLVSQFDSKEDLIQALICSAHVPFYSGILPPKYKGVRYVDGGLSVNNPILNENTITVSPFAGESDICPDDSSASFLHVSLAGTSLQLNSGNLYRVSHAFFPPPPDVLSDMCRQGFEDALQFLQKNNLINCTKHLSIESSLCSNIAADGDKLTSNDSSSSCSSLEDLSGSEDEEENKKLQQVMLCSDCQQQRESALLNSLPPSVVVALQSACDSVNKGLLAPVYNLRAFKVLSLMAAPWLLPVDVAVVLTKKFYEWVPYMPEDMQWFVKELVVLIGELVDMIQSSRHHYSARFTCQLAITEHSYDDATLPSDLNDTHILTHHQESTHKNMGVGFAVKFHAHSNAPVKRAGELRHHILTEDEKMHCQGSHDNHYSNNQAATEVHTSLENKDVHKVVDDFCQRTLSGANINLNSVASKAASKKVKRLSRESSIPDTSQVTFDTFENCLQTVEKMEALLSWYYTEENDPNTIKVTEIFPLNANNTGPEEVPVSSNLLETDKKWEEIKTRSEIRQAQSRTPKPSRKLHRSVSTASFNGRRDQPGSGVTPLTPFTSDETLSTASSSETVVVSPV